MYITTKQERIQDSNLRLQLRTHQYTIYNIFIHASNLSQIQTIANENGQYTGRSDQTHDSLMRSYCLQFMSSCKMGFGHVTEKDERANLCSAVSECDTAMPVSLFKVSVCDAMDLRSTGTYCLLRILRRCVFDSNRA